MKDFISRVLKRLAWAGREGWYWFKRDLLPYPLGWIGKYGMRLLLKSCQVEVEGLERFNQQVKGKCVLMLWHNRLVIMCEFLQRYLPDRNYAAFLSKSRDGEPIARVIQSYPHGCCIRVAHNLRHQALRQAIDYLNKSDGLLLITPDGPKGPRYKIKPGVLMAARQTRAPIVALSWEASAFWQFSTWDQFRLPKPFSKIKITLSAPIYLDSQSDPLEDTLQLQNLFNSN